MLNFRKREDETVVYETEYAVVTNGVSKDSVSVSLYLYSYMAGGRTFVWDHNSVHEEPNGQVYSNNCVLVGYSGVYSRDPFTVSWRDPSAAHPITLVLSQGGVKETRTMKSQVLLPDGLWYLPQVSVDSIPGRVLEATRKAITMAVEATELYKEMFVTLGKVVTSIQEQEGSYETYLEMMRSIVSYNSQREDNHA